MSPTPLAPTPPDDDLEARLRTAFAARADEVQLADLDPDLPSGTRIAIDDRGDLDRSHRGRARWVAVAAAVALVGAGIGLAARAGDDGATTTATDPSAPTTAAPRNEVFASFPQGVDPAVGEPFFVTGVHSGPSGGGRDPDAVDAAAAEAPWPRRCRRSVARASTAPMPTDLGLGADTWASSYSPTGAVDADLWGAAGDLDERGGVVVARPAPGGGWGVVAVTSERDRPDRARPRRGSLRGEVRVVGARSGRGSSCSQARSDGQPPVEDGVTATELTTTRVHRVRHHRDRPRPR